MDENRDSDTGQFTSSAEPLYGKEATERDAGYVPLQIEVEPEELTVKQAVELLPSMPGSEIKTYSPLDNLPDNVSLTQEQAAKILTEESEAKAKAAEEAEDEKFRDEVDELRGVKPEQKAKEPETPAEAKPGELDPEIEKALNNPKVQAALSEQIADVEAARQQHLSGVNAAVQIAQATFLSQFPEMAHIPPERMNEAIQSIIQNDPARAARMAAAIQRTAGLFEQQHIAHQQEAHAKARQFQEYAKASDARFGELVKDVPADTMKAVPDRIIAAVEKYGGDAQQFFEQYKTSEFLRDPIVQRMMVDAARFHMINDAKIPLARRAVPPVVRPGVSKPSGSDASEREQVLSRKPELTQKEALELLGLQSGRRRRAS